MTFPGYVYFIQVGLEGPIKIGWSNKPARRLASLQTAHWQTLHLIGVTPGPRQLEDAIQGRLKEHGLGREWFADTPEVQAEIVEPVGRVDEMLTAAIAARERIQEAIASLRDSEPEDGRESLQDALAHLLSVVTEIEDSVS